MPRKNIAALIAEGGDITVGALPSRKRGHRG
jgi:hypothetical protein